MVDAKNSATREGPTHKLKRTMWNIIKISADESPELPAGSYPQQRMMHCLTQPSPQLCLDSLVSSNDFACVSVLLLCFCLQRKLFVSFFLLFKYYSAALYWVAVYSFMSYLLVDSLVRFSSLLLTIVTSDEDVPMTTQKQTAQSEGKTHAYTLRATSQNSPS